MDKAVLKELHELNSFWRAVEHLKEQAPDIPPHDPQNPSSVEEWKDASAQRKGFELALSHLGVNIND